MENPIFFPAETRKFEDFGFMQVHLSFKPDLKENRKHFGTLTTIDDGVLKPGAKGFGLHGHNDVEVVTFMVEGEVNHIDPKVPTHGDTLKAKGIQLITAGTGIIHNEENYSQTDSMRALQIWFTPRQKSLPPNYSRKHLDPVDYTNQLQLVLSPDGRQGSLVIQQNVFMRYRMFNKKLPVTYQKQISENACYIYVINGSATVELSNLNKGDGWGILETSEVSFVADPGAELLVIDVPWISN